MGAAGSISDQSQLFVTIKDEYERLSLEKKATSTVKMNDFCEEDDDMDFFSMTRQDAVDFEVEEKKDSDHNINSPKSSDAQEMELYDKINHLYGDWYNNQQFKEKVDFTELVEVETALDRAFKSGLTPLIIDTSLDDKICTFFSYQPDVVILESKMLIFDQKKSLVDCLDYARQVLVNAMKHGKLLVIRLGSSSPDFNHKLNDDNLGTKYPLKQILKTMNSEVSLEQSMEGTDISGPDDEDDDDDNFCVESYFPREVFVQGGALLRNDTTWIERLYREDDMKPHKNFAICRDGFRVCVTSQLPLEHIQEYLFGVVTPDKNTKNNTTDSAQQSQVHQSDGAKGNLPDISLFKFICVQNEDQQQQGVDTNNNNTATDEMKCKK